MSDTEVEKPLYSLIQFPEGVDITDYYVQVRIGMCMAHNWMIRGLNSIHGQAFDPQTDAEKRNFAGYALCLTEFTHHHHAAEEKFLFPECEKRIPGSMQQNLDQHKLFHDGFETMETYFTTVQRDPSLYNGQKVRDIIETFGEVFVSHLTQEIGTLERSNLVEIFPVEADFRKTWDAMMKWAIGSSSKLTTMPWVAPSSLVITHHNEGDAPWFLRHEIPAIVIFLARYVFPWFNYGYWRWSPCSLKSVLKPEAKIGTVEPLLWESHKDK